MRLFVLLCILVSALGFTSQARRAASSTTRLYEDFDLSKTTIVSAPQIFSEKQLREFTSTYSEDERWNPFSALTGLFNKGEAKASTVSAPSSFKGALKATVSLEVLESKTAQFVEGKIDAKTFAGVLKGAFGEKLPLVLPEILSRLPSAKAAALSKSVR